MTEHETKTRKRLSKRQRQVIDDLFGSGLDEPAVLAKHEVRANLFRRWLADETFAAELSFRMESARRQSELIIARFAPAAAAKLVALAADPDRVGETARKACLDIINAVPPFTKTADSEGQPDEHEQLSPETVGRLLAALAKDN